MRRRHLLGLAAGTVAVGAVGSTVVASRPDGQPATITDERPPPVAKRDQSVLATRSSRVGAEQYGTVDQRTTVLDLDTEGEYALVGAYRITPGSNYRAGSGWKTRSLTVEHDWREGSIVSHRGDVRATDGDASSNWYLTTEHGSGRYRWRVAADDPTGNTLALRFATTVERDGSPTPGDTLVDATVGAGFTQGFLGGSERDVATVSIGPGESNG